MEILDLKNALFDENRVSKFISFDNRCEMTEKKPKIS